MYYVKCFKEIKRLKSKSRGVFRTQKSIYDGAFLWIYLTVYYFHNKISISCLTKLYIGLQKYWNFQSEAKVEQIITIVTTRSVSCYLWYWIAPGWNNQSIQSIQSIFPTYFLHVRFYKYVSVWIIPRSSMLAAIFGQ